MATNKKSFVLYCDIIHTVNKLTNEQAGELFKHVLMYVNDQDPQADNIITELAFEPIKQALKRDLEKYESICNRNSKNGEKGGRPKNQEEPKKPTGLFGNPKEPKKADSDIDIDIDSEIGIEIEKKIINNREKAIALTLERKQKFYNSLIPFLNQYPKETIKAFYDYWSELNKTETKMLWEFKPTFELSKRLATWNARDKNTSKPYQSESDKRREDAAKLSTMARHVVQNAVVDLSKI